MRISRTTMVVSMAGAATAVAAVALWTSRPTRREFWSDGRGIREAKERAPERRVLWRPAKALRSGGSEASREEYEPRLSADGTMMVLVRGRAGENADLYVSRWRAGAWSEPEAIAAINTGADELGPELSADSSKLYFYSDRAGGFGGHDLWVSNATKDGWGEPVNLGPAVNTEWNEYGPALSPEGDRIYFASNRPRAGEDAATPDGWGATVRERRTRHDYDLFVANVKDGVIEGAAPLTALNTADDEGAPAVSPAGDFLYFGSDRAGGYGGFDLYRARIGETLGAAAGGAENLGSGVNSAANELDPALGAEGFRLCFSSDREEGNGPKNAGKRPYRLWSTTSREVFLESDLLGPPLLSELARKVLLLALALLPLILLAWILAGSTWRKRLGRLSLLAQCVILSIALHAMIASMLAVWKVGSGILELATEGGGSGGTRVFLSTAGSLGAEGGGALTQLRSDSTLGASPLMDEAVRSASASELAPIAMGMLEPPGGEVAMERAEGPKVAALAPAAPMRETGAAAPPISAPMPERAEAEARVPGVIAAEAPMAERGMAAAEKTGDVHGPLAPTVVAVNAGEMSKGASLPAAEQSGGAAPVKTPEIARQTEMGTATNSPTLPAPAAAVVTADRGGNVLPEAGPKAQAGEERLANSAMNGEVGSTGASKTPAAGRWSLDAPPSTTPLPAVSAAGGEGDRGSRLAGPAMEKSREPQPSGPRENVGAGAPAAGVRAEEARVPTAAPGVATTEELPPPGAMAPGGSGVGSLSEPALPAARVDAGTGIAGAPLPAPVGSEPVGGGSVGLVPAPLAPVSGGQASAPIPIGAAPAGSLAGDDLPMPKETFDQRKPESRAELVERMGGSAETERAVGKALGWFANVQSADGRWSSRGFAPGCSTCGAAEVDADVGMTGLTLLCYLGAGHTHKDAESPYRERVERAIRWLVAKQAPDGDLRGKEAMYSQTVAAVALCEAYAMTRDPELAKPAQKAVEFVLKRATGANPGKRDTSVIGWLVFTVESARRAGFDVPESVFASAGEWLDEVSTPRSPGRYAYTRGGNASATMTAEAMFVQQILGKGRDLPRMKESAKMVAGTLPLWGGEAPTHHWYYATLALFQHQGAEWEAWNGALKEALLGKQVAEGAMAGSWDPSDASSRLGGRVYQTAICTLSLEVYYRYRTQEGPKE